jgi:hypothetical protein
LGSLSVASLRYRRSNSPHSNRSSRCRGSPATLTPNQAHATGQVLGDGLRLTEARAAGSGEEQRSATGAPRRQAGRGAEQRSSIRKGRPRSGATELDSRSSPCSPAAPPPQAASRSSAHPSTGPRREIRPAVRRRAAGRERSSGGALCAVGSHRRRPSGAPGLRRRRPPGTSHARWGPGSDGGFGRRVEEKIR